MSATPGPAADASSGRGRSADEPNEIPRRGWLEVLKRTKAEAKVDDLPLLAGGVAFFGLLALVPALAAIVSIYGLVADPSDVDRQVRDILAGSPAEVQELVTQQMEAVTDQSSGGLGVTAFVGLALALWSASSGMKHLIGAVNVAYDEEEGRGFVALRLRALALTVGAIGFVVVAVAVITGLPAVLAGSGLSGPTRAIVSVLRFPLLGAGLVVGLAVLYRFGPDRDAPRWSWTAPGTIVATVVWLAASVGFSLYTATAGSYAETYGALGAVVVLMLWLMISAAAVVLGAEVNAEAEKETARDTTVGRPRPIGRRDATAADTVAP